MVPDLNYEMILRAHPRPKSNGGRSQQHYNRQGKQQRLAKERQWAREREQAGERQREQAGERQRARERSRERAAELILCTLLYSL